MKAPRRWSSLVLLPLALLATTLGVLAVTRVAFATGGSPACMPWTTGDPAQGTLQFGCAPQTCAGTCSPTGGPGGGGTSGTMKCLCGTTVIVGTCLRTVAWTKNANGTYTRTVPPCSQGTCILQVCEEQAPIEGIPGTWCDCK